MMHGTTLEEKIDLSRQRLREIAEQHDPAKVAVAWTAGKDSTSVLHLWRAFRRDRDPQRPVPVLALNLDTGFKFQEILDFRDKLAADWGIELRILRPQLRERDYPAGSDPVQCCRDLKIEPLKRGLAELGVEVMLTGLRQDEHSSRSQRHWREERSEPRCEEVHPILHWTEMDVWSYHIAKDIPYCELYDKGYRSLSCRPCTRPAGYTERSGRDPRKEDQLDLLRSLGYF
jgi:phosphoadenosine phosphosulfate reductase